MIRKLKNYKPTRFMAEDSRYDKTSMNVPIVKRVTASSCFT